MKRTHHPAETRQDDAAAHDATMPPRVASRSPCAALLCGACRLAFAALQAIASGRGYAAAAEYLMSFGGFAVGARVKIGDNAVLGAAPLPPALVGMRAVIVDDAPGPDGKILVKCADGVERRLFPRNLWPL